MAKNKNYMECAKIINTHGCHGGLKLESWCNTPEDLTSFERLFICNNGKYVEHKVIKASVFKQFVIMDLSDITDMDTAMALKGTILYAAREDFNLDDGEFFIADLIGLQVIDAENGTAYGKVTDITNRGASDLYVVDTPNGERMVPDVFVVKKDVHSGVFVKVIPGLLD